MAPSNQQEEEASSGNLLTMLLSQAAEIDFSDPNAEGSSSSDKSNDPTRLLVEGWEISKLFAIIEFAFLHAQDEEGIMAGLDMMSRKEAIKSINGVFLFVVKNANGKEQEFFVDMRKTGTFNLEVPKKPKPDVTIRVGDKDMVRLATGQMNPQAAFLKGKLKVKGNVMLGLRCQNLLMKEVGKMSRL
ncbi:sterol-binding-like protein [Ceraceosorus guamensis]|uniref:Sterol-binding-like protein n=1 Tax=Ceraceosorus guamensis TaxID=1522189 RepID=A0A316W169_9BASI|nr:sterol-binding-like protein [Ceraceosorus guamensis]PWN41415.1 sterol-binding-like protein [Ceraceosorus guamensis]